MTRYKIILPALIAASAIAPVASFADEWDDEPELVDNNTARISDREADEWGDVGSESTENTDASVQENAIGGWEFSIQGAYLLAQDPIFKNAPSDYEIDTYGVALSLMKTTPSQSVGLEGGGFLVVSAGTAEIKTGSSYYYGNFYSDCTQIDVMFGGKLGLRFSGKDLNSPSFSIGAMLGADFRHMKIEKKSPLPYYDPDVSGSDSGSGFGFFYGIYASGEIPLGENFALTASVNYVCTQNTAWYDTQNTAWYEYEVGDVGYLMATAGCVFRF
ncbi:MAG: TonB-dependent receptor [Opitutales bacterium]|nr:TonB-dependent receptor [Opitutales bacterium]